MPVWEKWLVAGLAAACGIGWGALVWIQHRAKDPVVVVRQHFVFYPEYRSGSWSESACAASERAGCREVTYTVGVGTCGPVRFDWNVFADGDAELAYSYRGTAPKIDESAYALYAVVEDSRFMDSPALGKAPPAACATK
jgi:hypothetical protein